jgi:hypothetical protein
MLHFSESFVGGFFGFGRTYGAVARFECGSASELETDWPAALQETAAWRSRRGDRATVLHLYFEAPPAQVWETVAFVADQLLVPPDARAPELWGLALVVAVFGSPDMEQYLDLTLYPAETEAAGRP